MADVGGESGGLPPPADEVIAEQAAELATEVTEAEQPLERQRLTVRFAAAARAGTEAARSGARVTGRRVRATRRRLSTGTDWLTAQVIELAPRVKVRDRATLHAHFPGKSAEEIAEALIEGASRASAAVGGAVGAWAALPVLPAFPVEVATETLALVGIELKLVAELHEVYAMGATGSAVDRMSAYLAAWAHRRGVALVPGGILLAAGSPVARLLRRRLAARAGRSVFSLGPLLSGAAAGALLNRRETRRLGLEVHADLRSRAQTALPPGPADTGP
ncbi:MAG: hypothetical protein ACM32E_18745 [Gemmatimonadota bacterium]